MITSMDMNRRDLLERVLMLVGAATVARNGCLPAQAATPARAKPYLDQSILRILAAVADTIIPETDTVGAVGADVPASFDALLSRWASGEHRYQLIMALKEIDGKARQAHGSNFAELSPEQRHDLLAVHDAQAMQVGPTSTVIAGRTSAPGANASPPYPAYAKLKELIVLLYYISQPALTQELPYEHAPGEWKPSIPVTPETRTAGGGLI